MLNFPYKGNSSKKKTMSSLPLDIRIQQLISVQDEYKRYNIDVTLRSTLTFCLIQTLLWDVVALGFFYINGFYTDPWGLIFTIVFIVGHITFLALVVGMLGLLFGLIGPRAQQTVLLAGGIIGSFFLTADFVVFSQYRFHIGPSLLGMFFSSAGREIFVFSTGMWLMGGAIILAITITEAALLVIAKRWPLSRQATIIFGGVWLFCFLFYNGLYAWGKFYMVPSIMAQPRVLPFAYPTSFNRHLAKMGFPPRQSPYFIPKTGSLTYPLAPLSCPADKPTKNILIILVDAWRGDMLTPQIMPQLSAWAKKPGMHVFTNHLSGGNSTMGGVFSFFYGLPHSYWEDVTTQHLQPVLMEQALQRGYEPGIFASSQITSPAFHRNIFSAIPHLRIGSAGNSSWERDENAVHDFKAFLQTRDTKRPFFGFIFLDAPHAYDYPPQARKFLPAKEINYLLFTNHTDPTLYFNQYKNAVYFTDGLIAQVLEDLQQRGLLKDTFVVISADHGQELNDSHQNYWGHNSNFTDYQTKVPLLVYDPSVPDKQTVDYRTSHHDIAPTLLQAVFGCSNPPSDYALGKNLFDATPRPFTVFAGHTERAVRIGDAITVLDKFGGMYQYDNTLRPLTTPHNTATVREGLKSFRRFYR